MPLIGPGTNLADMFWVVITVFSAAGAGIGLVGNRLLRAVDAEVPAGWCELTSTLLWAVVAWRWLAGGWPVWWLPVPLVVSAFAVPLVFADLRHLRLPNVLTFAAYPMVAAAIAVAAAFGGASLALHAALGGLVFGGAHVVMHLLSPNSLGAGDVKLAGSIGAVLGAAGWVALVAGACLAAMITAALSMLSLLSRWLSVHSSVRDRFGGWRRGVPHGPGLLLATWLVALAPTVLSSAEATGWA